jgi:hypothetical protein
MVEPMKGALTTRSASISRIAIVVVAVTATLNLAWFVNKYSQLHGDLNQSIVRRDWMIAAALIIAALSLASKRGFGLMLSLIAFLWVLFEYLRWYFWTKKLLGNLDLTRFPPGVPHAAHLWGATGWNVLVLIIVSVLVIWEIVILVRILKSSHRAA